MRVTQFWFLVSQSVSLTAANADLFDCVLARSYVLLGLLMMVTYHTRLPSGAHAHVHIFSYDKDTKL